MVTHVLLVLLALLLLLAVGYVMYVVAQIVIAILRESFGKKRTKYFRHPVLGTLESDGNLWGARVLRNGREIDFEVAGTDAMPNATLLNHVESILNRFSEVEQQATAFLRKRESEVGQRQLEFYGLSAIDEKHPSDFTLEFIAENDGDRVWRVEFVADQPKSTGFDD